jgi:predicted dehydrogenase
MRGRATAPAPVEARGPGPVGVGIIGAGMISEAYLGNLVKCPDVRVIVIGDIDPDRARAKADGYDVEWGTPDDVLGHPDVELIVNITIPQSHAEVSMAAIGAGKHVWSEKPLTTRRETARALLYAAEHAGLLVGVAPDTGYGPGLQMARRVIARGDIGTPLSAQTAIQYPGPDLFHPNPEFLFAAGAGPLFDIGPYYLTALVHLFGSFSHVAAVGSTGHATRTIGTGPRAGAEFGVSVPTHVSAIAQFAGGAVSQSLISFDSPLSRIQFEVIGTEATLSVPDPNRFGGTVRITPKVGRDGIEAEPVWTEIAGEEERFGRGAGVVDMARCIRNGGTPIASGAVGFHVLDVMASMAESIRTREAVAITSTVDRVPMLPEAWDPYEQTIF